MPLPGLAPCILRFLGQQLLVFRPDKPAPLTRPAVVAQHCEDATGGDLLGISGVTHGNDTRDLRFQHAELPIHLVRPLVTATPGFDGHPEQDFCVN